MGTSTKRRTATPWSDGDVQLLRRQAAQKRTAADIAKQMGRSKEAVEGKARRMGIRLHVPAITAGRTARRTTRRPAARRKAAAA